MTKKQTKKLNTPPLKANTLTVERQIGTSRERTIAELALSPVMANARTASYFARGAVDGISPNELVSVMCDKAHRVKAGDLTEAEITLMAQAVALDAIFSELARRAALNMGESIGAVDTYLRLALKAQSQCRATLETLAEIKNPRAVSFVKQANIAHGPQQVNNGASTPADTSRTEKSANPSNELSGASNELLPDTRASAPTGRIDKAVETVGKVNRAKN